MRRPYDYRWSSYREYVREKEGRGLHRELILGQFRGGRREKVLSYRDYVEGALRREVGWCRLPILKQAFVGDEDFVEGARRNAIGLRLLSGRSVRSLG